MTRRTWYQVGRIIVLGLFVLFGILFLGWSSVGRVYSIVGSVIVFSTLLDFLFRRTMGEREWQVWVQFILDSILASILIRMAGGFDGPFT
ncbi:hypothetical protein DRQ25_11685, partial [Candidatus Fermentibacteria bacterium]